MNSSYCEGMKYKHYTCLKGPSEHSCLGVLYHSLPLLKIQLRKNKTHKLSFSHTFEQTPTVE